MGSTTTSTEIHGGNDSKREKWDLCSGGDGGRTADDGRGREGEPQRRNGSFKFAGDVFLHPYHYKFALRGVGILFIKIMVKCWIKIL